MNSKKKLLLFTVVNTTSVLGICLHVINKNGKGFPEGVFCPRSFIILFFLNCIFLIYLICLWFAEK